MFLFAFSCVINMQQFKQFLRYHNPSKKSYILDSEA